MISKDLVELVHIEASRLKENARPDELKKLDFLSLNPELPWYCIYGQITGSCYSTRAHTLIKKCASRVLPTLEPSCELTYGTKVNLHTSVNAKLSWSPIEVYILQSGSDQEQLINYLKGKRKTLNLNKTVNC